MNISYKRIQAIFLKDYKEFSRNYSISIIIIFPMLFALLYRSDDPTQTFMTAFVLNFSFAMLTSFIQACLIAEEKEKNTLRSLMMTPASIFDVLLGKSALVFVLSAVVLAVTVYLLGYTPDNYGLFIAATVLSIILYTALGTICGLFSKSVMEASLAIFPVLIIFTGSQFGAALEEKFSFLSILQYLPGSQFADLLAIMQTDYKLADTFESLGIMLVWTIAVTIISVILYKKRLMD
ncbi:MAG: ABC transporter permease [Solibacillus sp.]|jgi:ABC-2 type transport system permease protein|uniref:ABC transporter permease n=1 Tax=unclassified Solibacillus TaxID=2637870 RepID=UPI0030F80462